MDDSEKRILRRKRPLMAEFLGFSVTIQKKFKVAGLLTDQMLKNVLTEKTELGQVSRLIELLWNDKSAKASSNFERLMTLLESEGHSWLCDEMRADVLADRGELDIEDYIYREAGTLVHKHFGTSKRISEVEKKEIQYVIALRYQCAKEACQRQMEKIRTDRDEAMRFKFEETGKIKSMIEKIASYLRVQRDRINFHSHDTASAIDNMRDDRDITSQEYLDDLEKHVDKMFEVTSRVLLEKENLNDERKRCLEVMEITKPVMQLDVAVESALRYAENHVSKSKREADMSDQLALSLEARMRNVKMEAERELAAKERVVMMHEGMSKQKEDRIRSLDTKLIDARQQQAVAEEDGDRWRKRCMLLEKTRRLGYYRRGYHETLSLSDSALDEELARLENDQRKGPRPEYQRGKGRSDSPEKTSALLPIVSRPNTNLGKSASGTPTSMSPVQTGTGNAEPRFAKTPKDSSNTQTARRSVKGKGTKGTRASTHY